MTIFHLNGTSTGTSTLTQATLHLKMIFSGTVTGKTSLSDTFLKLVGGTTVGATSLNSTTLHIRRHLYGTTEGFTLHRQNTPNRLVGMTTLSAFCRVVHVEPVDPCGCLGIERKVRFGQVLTRGDLPLFIREGGRSVSPYSVEYCLFQIRPDGSKFQVGCTYRTPTMQVPGEYYVTGIAGRGGQPGKWQVQWSYRRSFNSPTQTETYDFKVVDSVSDPIPGDPTIRAKKYGWL